jgi:simple sugar transport system permease protein
MTERRGFIALAALSFGRWLPVGAIPNWSPYAVLFRALPYVLTSIAVAGVIGRSIPPSSIGRPYAKQ